MKQSLIKKFEQRMDGVETRLKYLECPHEKAKFVDRTEQQFYILVGQPYYKICCACGKLLEVYPTRESFLAAKADHAEEGLINLRQELDRERVAATSINAVRAKRAKQ